MAEDVFPSFCGGENKKKNTIKVTPESTLLIYNQTSKTKDKVDLFVTQTKLVPEFCLFLEPE